MKIELSKGSHSRTSIVTAPDAGKVVHFAAGELALYLYRITGAGFPIREEGDPAILSGRGIYLKVRTPEGENGLDSYTITTDPEGNILLEGINPRSTLYGVYAFLEHLGVIFAGTFEEYIPRDKDLAIPPIHLSGKAAFRERAYFRSYNLYRKEYAFDGFEPVRELPQISLLAKRKCNIYIYSVDYNRYDLWDSFKSLIEDAIYERGLKVHFLTNSLDFFFPDSENNDFGDFGGEYYLANAPTLYDKSGRADLGNEKVQEVIAERYGNFLAGHKEVEKIAFAPKKEFFQERTDEEKEVLLLSLKKLEEKILKKCALLAPGKSFQILLQEERPLEGIPDSQAISLLYRTNGRLNFHYPICHKENASYQEAIRQLAKRSASLSIVEDVGDLPRFLPFGSEAKERLLFYRENAVDGVIGFGGHSYTFTGTGFRWEQDLYIFTSLLWDLSADPAALLSQWAHAVYHEGGKAITGLFLTLAERQKEIREKLSLSAGQSWIDLPLFREMQKALAEARQLLPENKKEVICRKLDTLECAFASGIIYHLPDPESLQQDLYMR